MFWLIEGDSQFDFFSKYERESPFILPLWAHDNIHPKFNSVIGIFLYDQNLKKPFYISFTHNETLSLDSNKVKQWLLSLDKIYTIDKKRFLYFLEHPNIIDSNFEINTRLSDFSLSVIDWFYKKYPVYKGLNTIIPITKLFERFTSILEEIKPQYIIEKNDFLNDRVPNILYWLEQSPLGYTDDISNEMDGVEQRLNTFNNAYYNVYNPYSLTNRITSNITSRKKQFIVPKNDLLIEMDIRGYHVALLCKLIGYEIKEDDIHSHFAKLYNTDYQKAKILTFNQLYGGIKQEYLHIEFFNRANNFTKLIWEEYQSKGFIETEYGVKISNITNPTPAKLLNYLLQNLESFYNVCILEEIKELLKNKETKLINVNFDSFLFDASRQEKQIFYEIDAIFEKFSLKTKVKYGLRYNF